MRKSRINIWASPFLAIVCLACYVAFRRRQRFCLPREHLFLCCLLFFRSNICVVVSVSAFRISGFPYFLLRQRRLLQPLHICTIQTDSTRKEEGRGYLQTEWENRTNSDEVRRAALPWRNSVGDGWLQIFLFSCIFFISYFRINHYFLLLKCPNESLCGILATLHLIYFLVHETRWSTTCNLGRIRSSPLVSALQCSAWIPCMYSFLYNALSSSVLL